MRGPERTTKNIISFPMAEKQRAVSGGAKALPAMIKPEEPHPQVDLDAYAAACRLPPAEETEDEREARFQRERCYGL